jgi:chaperone required for assembly of F1-ATPase
VLLDGRPAKTPAGAKLALPTRRLASEVAAEWDAQGEALDFKTMPLTRLAFTAIDRTPAARAAIADEIANFAGSDVLCYFADAPQILIERQEAQWSPLLQWAGEALGVRLEPAQGVVHRAQPRASLERVCELALTLDDFRLTGLASAAGLFGSAVLAFAVERGRLDAATAFDLSRLDETFQAEQWGEDAEAAARTAAHRTEALNLGRWFGALAMPAA